MHTSCSSGMRSPHRKRCFSSVPQLPVGTALAARRLLWLLPAQPRANARASTLRTGLLYRARGKNARGAKKFLHGRVCRFGNFVHGSRSGCARNARNGCSQINRSIYPFAIPACPVFTPEGSRESTVRRIRKTQSQIARGARLADKDGLPHA